MQRKALVALVTLKPTSNCYLLYCSEFPRMPVNQNRGPNRAKSNHSGSLRDFKHNLKLLGLTSEDQTKILSPGPVKYKSQPKLQTKLRKTVSLSDLNSEEILENRALFNQLVYQQWYLQASNRQAELQKQQHLHLEELRLAEQQKKETARQNSVTAWQKWLERRDAQLKIALEHKRAVAAQEVALQAEKLRERAARNQAGDAWRLAKKEEFLRKLRENKAKAQAQREEQRREQEERRQAAQTAFNAWKRSIDHRRKNSRASSNSSYENEVLRHEKRRQAQEAYEEWKRHYDTQKRVQRNTLENLQNRLKQCRLQEEQLRLKEAQQRYEIWLERKALSQHATPTKVKRVPWYANCKSNCYTYWEYL